MSICPESVSVRIRSRSPSPEPIVRSASETGLTSRVLNPSMSQRLQQICESPPPPPVPVEEIIIENEKKKKILAPPMHYDLHHADAVYVYSHIKELTKNDTVASTYLEQIKPTMFAQRKPLVFGYIPAPPIEEIVKQVIGAKGYFFKMTTVVSGVYFIWHDTETNTFLFWGPSTFKVVKAMNSIRWRIFKHCEAYNAQQPIYDAKRDDAKCDDASDETDDDMPGLISCGSAPDYEHSEQN